MKTLILQVALAFILAGGAAAKGSLVSRADICINLAALYSGIPELQGDYFFNRYVGAYVSGGYLNKPRRGGVKVGEDVVLTDASGAYFKIGVKGRFVNPKYSRPVPWFQLMYIYSMYDEQGYREGVATPTGPTPDIYKHFTGSVNGIAASIGFDFPVRHRIDIRIGMQGGLYGRRDHLGIVANTFQPGIGAEPGLIVAGLNYRLGAFAARIPSKKPGR